MTRPQLDLFREFEGSKVGRYSDPWGMHGTSINADVFAYGEGLRNRSRHLRYNNEFAATFVARLRRSVLGAKGFQLQNKATRAGRPWDGANDAIEKAWADQRRAGEWDTSGRLTGREGDAILLEQLVVDGEYLALLEPGWTRNRSGFAVRYIDVERLDYHYNARHLPNGNRVIMSVELDGDDRPVAYHIMADHPEGHFAAGDRGRRRIRYPADRVLHGFIPLRPEQLRGVPLMHAAILSLRDIGAYREAAIVAARFGARKIGAIKSPDGRRGIADVVTEDGEPLIDLEESELVRLGPDESIDGWDPTYPHAQFESFNKAMLRGVSATLGIGYHNLTGDLESVNFATGRMAHHDEHEIHAEWQAWFAEHPLDRALSAWFETQMVLGRLIGPGGRPLPMARFDELLRPTWQARGVPSLEPLKDAQARAWRFSMGEQSISEQIRASGRDPKTVFAEVAEDLVQLRELGIEPRVISQMLAISAEQGQFNDEAASNDPGPASA